MRAVIVAAVAGYAMAAWLDPVPQPRKAPVIVLHLPRGSGFTMEARRAGEGLWLVMDTHRASEAGDGTEMHVIDAPAHEADIMVSVTAPTGRLETRNDADEREGYDGDL